MSGYGSVKGYILNTHAKFRKFTISDVACVAVELEAVLMR
jgi:hypothetical protein